MPEVDEDLETEDEIEKPAIRQRMKALEKERNQAQKEAEEGRAARKELMLLKAGLDVSTPTGKLFAKAYDGPYEEDAIKGAMAEYGIGTETSKEPDERAETMRGLANLAAGDRGGTSRSGLSDDDKLYEEIMELAREAPVGRRVPTGHKDKVLGVLREAGVRFT